MGRLSRLHRRLRRPVINSPDENEGRSWDLPDLHFSREQYVAEVDRASRDRSWETGRRRVARLLYERLEPLKLVLPPGLGLAGTWPAWSGNGVALMFQRVIGVPQPAADQQMLRLASTLSDPDRAAEDMAQQLLSTHPDEWVDSFGQTPED